MEDKLNREPIIKNLTQILEQINLKNGLVLGIDAGWGKGKTTFLNLWETYLKNEKTDNYEIIKFNAWENDDCGNPLISLVVALEKNILTDEKDIIQFVKILAKGFIPNLIDRTTKGGIRKEDIESLLAAHDSLNYDPIEQEKNRIALKTKFKESLESLAQQKKLIFFIDELDRCRPSYAIELLETIKHLFSVENCIFVIAWDKKQLSHSIKTIYGIGMDSLGYLRRFIDLDYQLPEPSKEKYILLLLERENLLNEYFPTFYKIIPLMSEIYDFSLRDIDKLIFYLKIHFGRMDEIKNIKETYKYVSSLLKSILFVVKFKNPELYTKIREKKYELNNISKIMNDLKISQIKEKISTDLKGLDNMIAQIITTFLRCNLANSKSKSKDYILFNSDGWNFNDHLDMQYFCENNKLFNEIEFLENLNKN